MKTNLLILIVFLLFCGTVAGETIEFEVPFPGSNATPLSKALFPKSKWSTVKSW